MKFSGILLSTLMIFAACSKQAEESASPSPSPSPTSTKNKDASGIIVHVDENGKETYALVSGGQTPTAENIAELHKQNKLADSELDSTSSSQQFHGGRVRPCNCFRTPVRNFLSNLASRFHHVRAPRAVPYYAGNFSQQTNYIGQQNIGQQINYFNGSSNYVQYLPVYNGHPYIAQSAWVQNHCSSAVVMTTACVQNDFGYEYRGGNVYHFYTRVE